ncbi:MAG: sigma-70 family RNA polymerase sigma factor [Sphingomonadaceae bacterium]|nr:sigma-70 family RNA polymerase sigma factor [Sphingomonadaceae bacterium]
MRLNLDLDATEPRLGSDDCLPPDNFVPLAEQSVCSPIDAVYRAQAPRLLRFFARKTHRHEAADLVQESFARLTRAAIRGTSAPDNQEAYLNRIAVNILRDRSRSAYLRSLSSPLQENDAPFAADPVATLEARDMLRRLDAALAILRPKTRDIFLAHRRDGLSYGEIGELTGLSIKGVEWHMSKAIAHITRSFK